VDVFVSTLLGICLWMENALCTYAHTHANTRA